MVGSELAFVELVTDEILESKVEAPCDIDDDEDKVEVKDPVVVGDAVSEVVSDDEYKLEVKDPVVVGGAVSEVESEL